MKTRKQSVIYLVESKVKLALLFLDDDNSSKILRFALDYCRASPNISFKNKAITNIGWRSSKYSLFAEFQMINQEGSKINVTAL